MKQIWFPGPGDPDIMEVREAPDPEPGPGEVRIVVEAAGVNFADVMARMGVYQDAPPFPFVVGYEVAGRIDAVGDGVDSDRIGDDVVAMTRFGGYSSHVCVPELQVSLRPEGVSAAVGAAVPVVGVTAWMILEVMGRVRASDRVLVHSAGGGVGLAALDLIKHHGATAVGTASPHKHEFLRERGYDELIDYRSVDYYEALKDGEGFDLILDPLGGASWGKGLKLLKPGGRLAMFGMSANASGSVRDRLNNLKNILAIPWLDLVPPRIINSNHGVLGINMGRMFEHPEEVSGWIPDLLERVRLGSFRPVVHAEVPFSNCAEAHNILHRRENVGKVVLIPD